MSDIKPALRAEEWEQFFKGGVSFQTQEPHIPVGCRDVELDAHALAATMLYDQPFGFTWGDVDDERTELEILKGYMARIREQGGDHKRIRKIIGRKKARITRIAVLLPPEKQ